MSCRAITLRDLSDVARDLGVSTKVVNELSVCSAEKPLANGAKPGLSRWPCLFRALIPCQERLKIGALKLRTTVYDDDLREALMARDAVAQNHHTRPVAWLIKCEIERKTPPRKGVGQDRHPRSAKRAVRLRANNLHVQLCVIDMADFKGPISVARRCQLQLEIKGRMGIGSAVSFPL